MKIGIITYVKCDNYGADLQVLRFNENLILLVSMQKQNLQ